MNLDDLTLGQLKAIERLFNKTSGVQENPSPHLGKKVIVRTQSAGVHYGTLLSKIGQECELKDAIRIWYWSGACSLSQLSMEGTKDPENCKFSVPVESITLSWIEIIPCTKDAIKSIEGVPAWKK